MTLEDCLEAFCDCLCDAKGLRKLNFVFEGSTRVSASFCRVLHCLAVLQNGIHSSVQCSACPRDQKRLRLGSSEEETAARALLFTRRGQALHTSCRLRVLLPWCGSGASNPPQVQQPHEMPSVGSFVAFRQDSSILALPAFLTPKRPWTDTRRRNPIFGFWTRPEGCARYELWGSLLLYEWSSRAAFRTAPRHPKPCFESPLGNTVTFGTSRTLESCALRKYTGGGVDRRR